VIVRSIINADQKETTVLRSYQERRYTRRVKAGVPPVTSGVRLHHLTKAHLFTNRYVLAEIMTEMTMKSFVNSITGRYGAESRKNNRLKLRQIVWWRTLVEMAHYSALLPTTNHTHRYTLTTLIFTRNLSWSPHEAKAIPLHRAERRRTRHDKWVTSDIAYVVIRGRKSHLVKMIHGGKKAVHR